MSLSGVGRGANNNDNNGTVVSSCKTLAIAVKKRKYELKFVRSIHVDTRFDFTVQYTVIHTTAFTTHGAKAPSCKSVDSQESS